MKQTTFQRGRRLLLAAAALPAAGWASAQAALWWGQERLLFHPQPLPPDAPLTQEADVQELSVPVPGAQLSVLWLRRPEPRGVVFFLHGNSGNLQEWFTGGSLYRQTNMDLVIMDYRGFGKSSGRIESEIQLHEDVEAVWRAVAPRYQGLAVVAYGRSLGTGLAAAWAARHQPDLTVLVSPYASMAALAAEHYPWVLQGVLRYPLRSDLAVAAIRRPLLLVHGDQDSLIPPDNSRTLLALAPSARLVTVPGAAHNDIHRFALYQETMAGALQQLR